MEGGPDTIFNNKFFEVAPYYVLTEHIFHVLYMVINEDFYQGLNEEDRAAFDYAGRAATFAMLGIIAAKESQDLKVIADAGVEIYQPTPEEFQAFVEKTQQPIAVMLADEVGAELIEELQQAIADAQQ
jgi:TRAP-type transport system periplasmic protein